MFPRVEAALAELVPDPRVREVVRQRHSEPTRCYHTLEHLEEMLHALEVVPLNDSRVVKLAVLFHDIVYDPKKKNNESESAILFSSLMNGCENEKKIVRYILETIKHDVSDRGDDDLKAFVDADMAVLGWERDRYIDYAKRIRKEYSFVDLETYRRKRSEFLFKSSIDSKPVYATELFSKSHEAVARANMAWEARELAEKRFP